MFYIHAWSSRTRAVVYVRPHLKRATLVIMFWMNTPHATVTIARLKHAYVDHKH